MPNFQKFVQLLDVDDAVAQKAIELLVSDVFTQAARRRYALAGINRTQPDAYTSRAHRTNASGARSGWYVLDDGTRRDAFNDDVGGSTIDVRRTAMQDTDTEEYNAVIAEARRRVASPLPLPGHPRASRPESDQTAASRAWLGVSRDDLDVDYAPAASTSFLRQDASTSGWTYPTLLDREDWPALNSGAPVAGRNAAMGNSDDWNAATINEPDYSNDSRYQLRNWRNWTRTSRRLDNLESHQIPEDDSESEVDSGDERVQSLEGRLNRARNARDLGGGSAGGTSASPSADAVATRHAIIERLEFRRRQRAERATAAGGSSDSRWRQSPLIASLLSQTRTSGDSTSSLPAASTDTEVGFASGPSGSQSATQSTAVPVSSSAPQLASTSLPIVIGGDFTYVPTSASRTNGDDTRAGSEVGDHVLDPVRASAPPLETFEVDSDTSSLFGTSPNTGGRLQRTNAIRRSSGFLGSSSARTNTSTYYGADVGGPAPEPESARPHQTPERSSIWNGTAGSHPRLIPRSPIAHADEIRFSSNERQEVGRSVAATSAATFGTPSIAALDSGVGSAFGLPSRSQTSAFERFSSAARNASRVSDAEDGGAGAADGARAGQRRNRIEPLSSDNGDRIDRQAVESARELVGALTASEALGSSSSAAALAQGEEEGIHTSAEMPPLQAVSGRNPFLTRPYSAVLAAGRTSPDNGASRIPIPGAPIISRRQFPLSRSLADAPGSSPQSVLNLNGISGLQGAANDAQVHRPMVIRWPAAVDDPVGIQDSATTLDSPNAEAPGGPSAGGEEGSEVVSLIDFLSG